MVDVEALLSALSVEEKAALTAGEDAFSTPAIERLGIPKVRLTDGPNGARGTQSFPNVGGPASSCTPCGSAVGASWDPVLAQELGDLLGREAADRGCRFLLAPTVNLHRNPRAGRNFECFSEDPLLSGRVGVGVIRGVQGTGVAATVKHFVANECELERNTQSSVVDERTLRELYLVPFEMAVREGGVLAVMTAYNRLNGSWLNEERSYLTDLLRSEWGFKGLVMTDWFAYADTGSLHAGLDLEMPGPGRAFGASLATAVNDGTATKEDLDVAVRRILTVYNTVGALDQPTAPVTTPPTPPEDAALLRRAAAECSVLLSNDGVLPLQPGAARRIALIGPHAAAPSIMGGGSAGVVPHPGIRSLLNTLPEAVGPSAEVVYARGCEADKSGRVVGSGALPSLNGFAVEVFNGVDLAGEPIERKVLNELRVIDLGSIVGGWPTEAFSLRVTGTVVPVDSGRLQLALTQAGRARVAVDGNVVIDGYTTTPPPGGTGLFGLMSAEMHGEIDVIAGRPMQILVEYARIETPMAAFQVGSRTVDLDRLLDDAVDAAKGADVAVVCVGTTEEWESEGHDRPDLMLPGRQAELVRRVAAVNPKTVVVVNAGAPVEMPWSGDVAAILLTWFGGQEMGAAQADVLVGKTEPGGRLPMTLPMRLEHSPTHDSFPGENGEVRYGEGLFMGYRGHDHRHIAPRFAFGHGLGYTTFDVGAPAVSAATIDPGESTTVTVQVRNTGPRDGACVVQCYVAPRNPRLVRPPKELKAFAKVRLAPGAAQEVTLELGPRAFSYWDSGQRDWDDMSARMPMMANVGTAMIERRSPGWYCDPGTYDVLIGTSAEEIVGQCPVEVVAAP